MLLREADQRLGLIRGFDRALPDLRDLLLITHEQVDLLRGRVLKKLVINACLVRGSLWESLFWLRKITTLERFLLRAKNKRPIVLVVDMTIMNTLISSASLFFCAVSQVFATDVVLREVAMPQLKTTETSAKVAESQLGPQATFALINYNLRDTLNNARALYVSSGNGDDLMLANSMIDDQVATSFGFSVEDKSPTAVIDLGKVCTVRRLSAVYSPRPGSIDFYVMQSLPEADRDNTVGTMKLDNNGLGDLKPAGSAIDDGTQGRASIEFPAITGRYVMLRWTPAAQTDTVFTVAEVSAFGASGGSLLAANVNFPSNQTTERTVAADSKDVADFVEPKDIPEEGPSEVPPRFPVPPSFTFIPQIVPVSR